MHKSAGIPPEGQRNRISARTKCDWRITFSCPKSRPSPWISTVLLVHNHDLDPNIVLLDKLDLDQTAFVENFATLGKPTVTQTIQLLENMYPDQYFDKIQVSNVMQQARTDYLDTVKSKG